MVASRGNGVKSGGLAGGRPGVFSGFRGGFGRTDVLGTGGSSLRPAHPRGGAARLRPSAPPRGRSGGSERESRRVSAFGPRRALVDPPSGTGDRPRRSDRPGAGPDDHEDQRERESRGAAPGGGTEGVLRRALALFRGTTAWAPTSEGPPRALRPPRRTPVVRVALSAGPPRLAPGRHRAHAPRVALGAGAALTLPVSHSGPAPRSRSPCHAPGLRRAHDRPRRASGRRQAHSRVAAPVPPVAPAGVGTPWTEW